MRTKAGDSWRNSLSAWGIPYEILNQAPVSPWIHPVELFQVPDEITITPSHLKALEIKPDSVLDVGCGGGVAAFALVPPATKVIGVDHQPEMLQVFAANAVKRKVAAEIFEGFWPEVAQQTPKADVVVSHHVLYNVSEIESFLIELGSHANKRVVIEIPQQHPQSDANYLWKHFWQLERPNTPTPESIIEILKELGIQGHVEYWESQMGPKVDIDKNVEFTRIRLCLDKSKDAVIKNLLLARPTTARKLATIWWDK